MKKDVVIDVKYFDDGQQLTVSNCRRRHEMCPAQEENLVIY